MREPVDTEPEVLSLVVKPVPVQEVAFDDDQVRVALCPLLMGPLLESEAVGRFETVTVVLCSSDPIKFVQVSVKVLLEVMLVMVSVCEPAVVSFDPDQSPDAVQEVGEFVDDQVRIDEPPLVTEEGDAERVTVGTAEMVTVIIRKGQLVDHAPTLSCTRK